MTKHSFPLSNHTDVHMIPSGSTYFDIHFVTISISVLISMMLPIIPVFVGHINLHFDMFLLTISMSNTSTESFWASSFLDFHSSPGKPCITRSATPLPFLMATVSTEPGSWITASLHATQPRNGVHGSGAGASQWWADDNAMQIMLNDEASRVELLWLRIVVDG